MKEKLIYDEINTSINGLPWWKCLHDENKIIYEQDDYFKYIKLFI